MHSWHKATILLTCLYGILKKIRPGTPFLTPFLETEKNLTTNELYGEVFPYWTYSNMLTLVPIFFLSDLLRYRPIIILEGCLLFATWLLLVYGSGVRQMQIMQIFFGIATSAEVAYASYLYAIVDVRHYKRITSYVASATMCGKFVGYSLGQILVSAQLASYLTLNKISLYVFVPCILMAFFLPSTVVSSSDQKDLITIFFDSQSPEEMNLTLSPSQRTPNTMNYVNNLKNNLTQTEAVKVVQQEKATVGYKFSRFLLKQVHPYRNGVVLSWSIWWALASCGMLQVFNYSQTLWALRQQNGEFVANGFVESLNTLIGALMSFVLQFSATNWQRHAEVIFIASSFIIGALLFAMIRAATLLVDYLCYLCASTLFNLIMTIANYEIAIQLSKSDEDAINERDEFGDEIASQEITHKTLEEPPRQADAQNLADAPTPSNRRNTRNQFSAIFGANTLAALLCQSALTRLITDKNGVFALDIQAQFQTYGVYFFAIGALFSAFALRRLL